MYNAGSYIISYIKKNKYSPSAPPVLCVNHAQGTTLDSEMGWNEDVWLKIVFQKLQHLKETFFLLVFMSYNNTNIYLYRRIFLRFYISVYLCILINELNKEIKYN